MLEKVNCPADLRGLSRAELRVLATEIREELVSTVTRTGGHLASNLGVVELTIALHYVFSDPNDSIVWDVGHQAYVHKLLTGRRERFASIRQCGGLSGFCCRDESPYDAFGAGHAGTSVSAALGLAVGRDLLGKDGNVVAVIGDGAMTCGLAFEGVNNAGNLRNRFVVVLNDNEMSISPNVGAMAKYTTRLRVNRRYQQAKVGLESLLGHMPFGSAVLQGLRRLKQAVRYLLMPTIWEELGFTYIGPHEGHDIDNLVEVFQRVKSLEQPVLVHVATVKGKGYASAEADAVKLHSVSPRGNGAAAVVGGQPPTYTEVFSDCLLEAGRHDPRVVAITAAMPDGTGLTAFARAFPDRFFDVGIAEGHAVTYAAGLAAAGLRPVVAIYSTFMQRSFDSVLHDVCLQNLPVVLALDRAGLVGEDGRTHHGLFDLAFLRCIPNLVVMAPGDENELRHMLHTALTLNRPVAVRYPRGPAVRLGPTEAPRQLPVGQATVLREGRDVALIAIGSTVDMCLAAATILEGLGWDTTVVNARFVQPLDSETLLRVARQVPSVLTVEEHVRTGGFGSAVAELIADNGLDKVTSLRRLAIPDVFVEHGSVAELRRMYDLTPDGIARTVIRSFSHPTRVSTLQD